MKKIFTVLLVLVLSLKGITIIAQCQIEAGINKSIICGSSIELNASSKWATINDSITTPLFSVYFVNTDTGYAVGGVGGMTVGGTIFKTTNGGLNWTPQVSGTYNTLNSVFFVNADTGYVVGDLGTILKTTNGGTSWVIQPIGSLINPLNSVYFVNADTGYVVGGENGIILKTTDGGTNWIQQFNPSNNPLRNVVFFNSNIGVAVGFMGTILKTNNGGNNWYWQNSYTTNTLYSVKIINQDTYYTVGTGGCILKTINGGSNWNQQSNNNNSSDFYSVNFINENIGYISGVYGKILKTLDGGTNWILEENATASDFLNSMFFTKNNTGYITSLSGKILKLAQPVNYVWTPINGLSSTSISNPIANPIENTKYHVTATFANGCIATDSISITINPVEIIGLTDKNLLCGDSVQLSANTSWNTIITGVNNNYMNSIYFVNDNIGYVVGNDGLILKTIDGGTNWLKQNSGTTDYLSSVIFLNADTGFVSGGMPNTRGIVLKTMNGGETWTLINNITSNYLRSIYFTDYNNGYTVCDNGYILKSTNGGTSWSIQNSGTSNYLYSIFFTTANAGIAVGNNGTILKTTNGGSNWTTINSGINSTLTSVYFTDINTGYIIGTDGIILKTINGGATWASQNSNVIGWLRSIHFLNSNTGYIVGMENNGNGIILKTTNGGTNWMKILSDYNESFTSVFFINDTTGFATTYYSGKILKYPTQPYIYSWLPTNGLTAANIANPYAKPYETTTYNIIANFANGCIASDNILLNITPFTIDAGYDKSLICGSSVQLNVETKWTKLISTTTNTLRSVFFLNKDTGYAVGNSGYIMKTTNGGSSWNNLQNSYNNNLQSIFFADANNGYAVGEGGMVLKTTNGGYNWSLNWTYFNLNSVFFTSKDTGYTVGISGKIFKTINGGTNWIAQTSGITNDLNSVYFISKDTGYVVGNNGKILKTTNGGTNWTLLVSGTTNNLKSVYFLNSNNGCVVGSQVIIKTTNGGNNWISATSGNMGSYQSVFFTDSQTGYAVGSGGAIAGMVKTVDGGNTWQIQPIPSAMYFNNLYSIYFSDLNTGYAVGDNGTILKLPKIPDFYTWTPSNSLNSSNIINPFASPNTSTTYLISTSTNGCIATDSITVNVTPLNANLGFDKSIICGGTAFLDSITSNYIGNELLKYLWVPSTGLNNDTIARPRSTVTENISYYVTVRTQNGCIYSDSVRVYVNPLTANAGMDKFITCGGTAQLDYVQTNYTGNSVLYYLWNPATGLNFDTIANPTSNTTNNITYSVTVTTQNGCFANDSVKVYVNPLTANAGMDKFITCGGTVQLDYVQTNYTGNGALSYLWNPSTGLNFDTIANPTTTANNITYTVTVSTPNECTAIDGVSVSIQNMSAHNICIVSVDSDNKNMIVWEKPINLAIDSFYIYRETDITGNYQRIGSVPYDSMSIFIDTLSQPNVQSNKYKISLIDSCRLETNVSEYHKTMHLAINQGMGNVWNLIWEPYQGFTVSTYRIYRGTDANNMQQIGTTSGGSTQYSDLTPPTGYVYYQVEIISPQQCNPTKSINSSRSNVATNNPSSIYNNSNNDISFSIFPNPVNDKISVKCINIFPKDTYISICNMQGKEVVNLEFKNQSNINIDVNSLSSGIYFLKVITEQNLAIQKFVKQ